MSAAAAGLRGRKPAVHLHQAGTFPSELIGKHIPEHPEPVIVEVLSQGKGPAHPPQVQELLSLSLILGLARILSKTDALPDAP